MSTKPEVGKRYRMSGEVVVNRVYEGPGTAYVFADGYPGCILKLDAFEWEEVEPEYVVDALYVDADEDVYRYRSDLDLPWVAPDGSRGVRYFDFDHPSRPLERLYRESELPK
jgi:hypothetical protein